EVAAVTQARFGEAGEGGVGAGDQDPHGAGPFARRGGDPSILFKTPASFPKMRAFLYPSRARKAAGSHAPEEGSMRWLALLSVALVIPVVSARAAEAPKGKIVYSRKDGDKYLLHVMNADGTEDKAVPGQTDAVN